MFHWSFLFGVEIITGLTEDFNLAKQLECWPDAADFISRYKVSAGKLKRMTEGFLDCCLASTDSGGDTRSPPLARFYPLHGWQVT